MYTRAYWEDVNSIKDLCTYMIRPNLSLTQYTMVHLLASCSLKVDPDAIISFLSGRPAPPCFQEFLQIGKSVSDGPTELSVPRSIPTHPRFCEPTTADAEECCSFLGN
jgi:hypothetical protein